jgi:hypothetical protein
MTLMVKCRSGLLVSDMMISSLLFFKADECASQLHLLPLAALRKSQMKSPTLGET